MRHRRLLAFAILISCSFKEPQCNAATPPEVRAEAVLFNQFETVAYTRTDLLSGFDIRELDQDERHTIPELPFTLRLPFVTLVGGLRALGSTALRVLGQSYTAFAVGAKNFTPPHGFGIFNSQACYIGIAERGAQLNLVSVFSQAKSDVIAGTRAWVWSIPPSEGHPVVTTFYAAQIADLYLFDS